MGSSTVLRQSSRSTRIAVDGFVRRHSHSIGAMWLRAATARVRVACVTLAGEQDAEREERVGVVWEELQRAADLVLGGRGKLQARGRAVGCRHERLAPILEARRALGVELQRPLEEEPRRPQVHAATRGAALVV